jgi:hypothetical protein
MMPPFSKIYVPQCRNINNFPPGSHENLRSGFNVGSRSFQNAIREPDGFFRLGLLGRNSVEDGLESVKKAHQAVRVGMGPSKSAVAGLSSDVY